MNTATQPTAGATRRTTKRKATSVWPLRRPDPKTEDDRSFWAVYSLSATLLAEAMREEMLRSTRRTPVLARALSDAESLLGHEARQNLRHAMARGGLLFCWEGSSVMHTPLPAVQP